MRRADENQSSALKICVAESKEKGFSKDYEKAMKNPIKSPKIRRTCGQLKTSDFCGKCIEKQSGGIFTKGEYSYRSPLVSELPTASLGMRTHVANATVSKSVHRLGAKKEGLP